MKPIRSLTLALLFLPLLVCCCSMEETGPEERLGEQTEVEFTVTLPGAGQVTRALSDTEEYAVKTVEVLVFDYTTGRYMYTAYANQVESVVNNTCKFKVNLITGTCDLMVLVNSRQWITQTYGGAVPTNKTKADLEKELIAGHTGKWVADTSDPAYIPIPMWGEKTNETIVPGSTFSVTLTRMLARIDVSLGTNAKSDFTLKAVRLYNYNTAGRVIPERTAAYWDGTKAIDASPLIGNYKVSSYHEYTDLTTAGEAIEGGIYAFESAAGSRADFLNNTCLLIYGEYDGVDYYYRADFERKSGTTTTYLPLKRNHRYKVDVQSVTGPGFVDPDEALKSLSVNFEVQFVGWHDPDMDDMQVDGEYYFSITPPEALFWGDGGNDNNIKVLTNYPKWSYKITDSPTLTGGNAATWVVVTSGQAQGVEHNSAPAGDIITYNVGTHNGTGRTAYVHISAGRFSSSAKVVQHPWIYNNIYVTPTGIIDPAGETRTIRIEGRFEATSVRARDLDTGMDIVQGTVPAHSTGASAQLAIPAWMSGDRTVAFEYLDARHNLWRIIRTEEQMSDPTKNITVKIPNFTAGQSIGSLGGAYQLEVAGNDRPVITVRAFDGQDAASASPASDPVTIPAGTGTENSFSVTVKSNESWSQRPVYFMWTQDGTQWYPFTQGVQGGYAFTQREIDHEAGSMIDKNGQTFTITIDGHYSDVQFRATVNGVQIGSIATITAGTSLKTTTLEVPKNDTAEDRNVIVQYSTNNGANWSFFTSGNQPSIYYVLPSGRILAQEYAKLNGTTGAETMNWAQAMGIDEKFNNQFFYSTYPGGEVTNAKYTPTEDTGCGAYWEESETDPQSGKGKWRVPTTQELILIVTLNTPVQTWVSEENTDSRYPHTTMIYQETSVAGVWAMRGGNKTSNGYIRCVRSANP